jgi:hypothetical protein
MHSVVLILRQMGSSTSTDYCDQYLHLKKSNVHLTEGSKEKLELIHFFSQCDLYGMYLLTPQGINANYHESLHFN